MIIAREKKKSNIVEYILYMFQIENSLRALGFDGTLVEEQLVRKYNQPEEIQQEIRDWYADLLQMMKDEKITEKGHLQFIRNTMNDLYGVHVLLIRSGEDKQYEQVYAEAKTFIELLRKKTGNPSAHDVETGIEGIYGYLLLQIKEEKITEETKSAITKITEWLYLLAVRYRQLETGEREI